MHPPAAPAIVCHVLLLDTDRGLLLVDTGFVLHDIADPARRIDPIRHLLRPVFSPDTRRPPISVSGSGIGGTMSDTS